MPFQKHVLKNGLRIIGETNASARSVALGFFVRTGSRDERTDVSGVTHFLEHMVFKGTPRRSALDVNRDFPEDFYQPTARVPVEEFEGRWYLARPLLASG